MGNGFAIYSVYLSCWRLVDLSRKLLILLAPLRCGRETRADGFGHSERVVSSIKAATHLPGCWHLWQLRVELDPGFAKHDKPIWQRDHPSEQAKTKDFLRGKSRPLIQLVYPWERILTSAFFATESLAGHSSEAVSPVSRQQRAAIQEQRDVEEPVVISSFLAIPIGIPSLDQWSSHCYS